MLVELVRFVLFCMCFQMHKRQTHTICTVAVFKWTSRFEPHAYGLAFALNVSTFCFRQTLPHKRNVTSNVYFFVQSHKILF